MIQFKTGNIFENTNVDAIVNTVNCVGVMGRGIALQFKKKYPENFKMYQAACKMGEVVPGKMFVFKNPSLIAPYFIINFPTKRHWKYASRMEDIKSGLKDLVYTIKKHEIKSVVIPPLGCGSSSVLLSFRLYYTDSHEKSQPLFSQKGTGFISFFINLTFLLSYSCKLAVIDLSIKAVLCQQLFVLSFFYNMPVAHNKDHICLADSRKTMGNNKAGPSFHHLGKGFLNTDLSTGINRGCCLI